MKNVSLDKVRKSVAAKVAGLSILAIFAIGFLAVPLAALADVCGNEHITPNTWMDGTAVQKYVNDVAHGTTNPVSPTFQPFNVAAVKKVPNYSIIIGTHTPQGTKTPVPGLSVVVGNQVFGLDYDAQLAMSEHNPHHAKLYVTKTTTLQTQGQPQTYIKKESIHIKFWLNGNDLLAYINKKTGTAPTFQAYKAKTQLANGSFLVGVTATGTPAFAVVTGNQAYGLDYTTKPGMATRPGIITLLDGVTIAKAAQTNTKKS